ncbi:MAG: hypothetical protein HY239_14565, partial [Mycolicibacterium aromaticivorans]|nr:hypothetical protein [Mycolicibacterium aromaticivorans]
ADLLDTDARVREGVLRALDYGMTEVALWGEAQSSGLDRAIDSVEHRLSSAARVFKAQALAAADVQDVTVAATETFRSGAMSCPPIGADLVPAG